MKLKNSGETLTVKLKTKPTVDDYLGHWIAIGPGKTIEVPDDLDWKKQYREICKMNDRFEVDQLFEVKEPVKETPIPEVEKEEPVKVWKEEKPKRKRKKK